MMIDDQLSALFDDPDFAEVQRRTARFNIFEAVGAVHAELRHSNFLGYLLAPSRPHGLGARPLAQVLRRLLETVPSNRRPLSTVELLVGDLDDAVVHRERDSIDLLIEIDSLQLVVLIENKVHAKAGDGQLRRYRELVERRYPTYRRLLIFLTPEGTDPHDPAYLPFSYAALAGTLDTLVSDLPAADATKLIVSHYTEMLRTHIVEDEYLRGLAARLYERHAEALDFIFESRPRQASLVELVGQRVRSIEGLTVDTDGISMLRFAPDRWDAELSLRIDKKKWTRSGRGLLFEVKSFNSKPGRINVSLILGPGETEYREAFYRAAQARPELFTGLVKPMGLQFSTVFSRDLLTAEKAATIGAEAQANNVSLAWSNFQGETLPLLITASLEIDAAISDSRAG
ncbi:PD-(D/E)XK nuclease family protein [Sphingomonas sp. CJ20]